MIILNDKLIASIGGKLIDKYYRAVLIKGGRFDNEHPPNGNPDTIKIEQPFKDGSWGGTASWYVETLMGRDEYGGKDGPSDSIYIDGGQRWKIESGMLLALDAYAKHNLQNKVETLIDCLDWTNKIREDAEAGALVLHARKYFGEDNNE